MFGREKKKNIEKNNSRHHFYFPSSAYLLHSALFLTSFLILYIDEINETFFSQAIEGEYILHTKNFCLGLLIFFIHIFDREKKIFTKFKKYLCLLIKKRKIKREKKKFYSILSYSSYSYRI